MTSGENVADVSAVAIPLNLGIESFALVVAVPLTVFTIQCR